MQLAVKVCAVAIYLHGSVLVSGILRQQTKRFQPLYEHRASACWDVPLK